MKELEISFIIAWAGYMSSAEGNLVVTMQAQPTYLNTCLWLLAFLLFGYTLAIVLKTMYDIEGEKKDQMYRELGVIRSERHKGNEAI